MTLFLKRKTLFVFLFTLLVALAGFNQYTANADSNGTIPPGGGTLPPGKTGINVLHIAPFSADSDVDVVISSGNVTAQYNDVALGKSTGAYLIVNAGSANGIVTPSTVGGSFPFSANLAVDTKYTVAAIGGANGWPVDFLTLVDSTAKPAPLTGKIRIVHAAPFVAPPAVNTALNVVEQSGNNINPLFEGLLYEESTPFVTLPSGYYDWKVQRPNGTVEIDLPPFNLYSEAVVTIYLVAGEESIQEGTGLYVINELGKKIIIDYFPINMW